MNRHIIPTLGILLLLLTTPLCAQGLPDALVTPAWLQRHLGEADLRVLDSTVLVSMNEAGEVVNRSGFDDYRQGHIPGALFADLIHDLAAPTGRLRMPSAERLAGALGALGIENTDRVVIYSAANPSWAARLWWMMRWVGHQQVAILDGGLTAWEAGGHRLESGAASRPATRYVPDPQPQLLSTIDDVRRAIDEEQLYLLDAMPAAHYVGDFVLHYRPGHIPSARNVPTAALVDANGRYRPADELALLVDAAEDDAIITYCGGGVAAANLAFALTRAGFRDVRVYMGSLEEWAADPDNPMVTGPAP